ncbi:uncharacterized protein LOC128209891 isoform X2 [Mya arenaria]|uniref:uncharacterized protein LOC128209891 isoform X2 n=1 Tax=Mya arenaria TaxID=6604 RepID=UPI0022E278CD|nr:uncharacterized protein LOC128209891 isoform X2 [Mya arenaria]
MASKQIQCEMCCNENAVGYCKTCGNVGETCLDVHKTVKVFQTHMVSKNDENDANPKVIKQDITEERCKQHPTERAIFLCNIHDSMICGRCLHSGHLSCGQEIVDLLHEAASLDFEKVNKMKSALKEVKDEIFLLKDEAEHSKNSSKNNAEKCVQECMELGNRLKQRVDELTSDIIHRITKVNDINVITHSSIAQMCTEKTKWCDNEESKIDDFVDNNMAGHLYLLHRHFEKEVLDASFHLKEIKHKHTFKGFDLKENKVILKCLFEDLEEVCEQQEEVTGSDDGSANEFVASTTKVNKTRRELTAMMKKDFNQAEKKWNLLEQELQKAKEDIEKSEKKLNMLEQELLKAKQDIQESEKTRKGFEQELLKAKQCKEKYEKMHHASPGKPYKGGTFTGSLLDDSEGQLLCRMLKAAFRRGLMFNLGKEGKVVLDGISLYNGPVFYNWTYPDYKRYTQTLKAELSAKGITKANIDQTEELYETVTVDGLRFLEASLSS